MIPFLPRPDVDASMNPSSVLQYAFTFVKTRDAYSVEDALVKEVFFELRQDVEKMALAQYFCELANEFCDEDYDYNRFGAIHLIVSPVKLSKHVTKNKKKKLQFVVVFYIEKDVQFYLAQTLLEGTNTIYKRGKYKLGYYKGGNILDE